MYEGHICPRILTIVWDNDMISYAITLQRHTRKHTYEYITVCVCVDRVDILYIVYIVIIVCIYNQ